MTSESTSYTLLETCACILQEMSGERRLERAESGAAAAPPNQPGAYITLGSAEQLYLIGLLAAPHAWRAVAEIGAGKHETAPANGVLPAHAKQNLASDEAVRAALCELVSGLGAEAKVRMEAASPAQKFELSMALFVDGRLSGPAIVERHALTLRLGANEATLVVLAINQSPEVRARIAHHRVLLKEGERLRQAHEQIDRLSNFDQLTGLPNRSFLESHLQRILKEPMSRDSYVALIVLDLDHFARVNNSFGHSVGDEVLRTIAERLSKAVRRSDMLLNTDKVGPTLARFDGDEFGVVLPAVRTPGIAATVARRLAKTVSDPVYVCNQMLRLTASFGISIYPVVSHDQNSLFSHAHSALSNAKDAGRDCFKFYAKAQTERALRRISIERDLTEAIENGGLRTYFQPRVDIEGKRVLGAEALVRWNHPERGFISPDEFIPIAEDTGLVVPLGNQVLREACMQAKRWHEAFGPLTVSVNVASRQLTNEFMDVVRECLRESGLPPEHLELEITERTLLENSDANGAVIQRLKNLGVRITLDDFGTGFSSLGYLVRFPIDVIKIDRSFIMNVVRDRASAAVTSAIIALGKNLGTTVVAEGVEELDQLAFLKKHGCDEIQGYLYSRAVPADEFAAWIEAFETHGRVRNVKVDV